MDEKMIEDTQDESQEDVVIEESDSLEEIKAKLDKALEEKENLTIALKKEREVKKTIPQIPKKELVQEDISSIVERTIKAQELSKKFDGSDGNPKFDKSELAEYASEIGIDFNKVDLEQLYRLKYMNNIIDNSKKEVLKANKGVITSDGKAISPEALKDKLRNATDPKEIARLMASVKP